MCGLESKKKLQIFRQPELNNHFQEFGWVIVNVEDAQKIIEINQQIKRDFQYKAEELSGHQNHVCNVTFHSTFLDSNKSYKEIVKVHLSPLFENIIEKHLSDYKIIQLNIFNKLSNSGFVGPHQNLTTVDEDVHTSLSIWIPLQDTHENNGCLYFKPKSHQRFEKYRNPYIYWPPLKCSTNIEDYNMIPIRLKFGEMVIFDDSLVHASPDNFSLFPRSSFHALVIPKQAQPIYPRLNRDKIDIIAVQDDFWFYYSPGDTEPTQPIIRNVPYQEKRYNKDDILT